MEVLKCSDTLDKSTKELKLSAEGQNALKNVIAHESLEKIFFHVCEMFRGVCAVQECIPSPHSIRTKEALYYKASKREPLAVTVPSLRPRRGANRTTRQPLRDVSNVTDSNGFSKPKKIDNFKRELILKEDGQEYAR